MAYELGLPARLKTQGWKVKISNMERVEPPHVTIIRKTTRWRYGLRERRFLDDEPNPSDVPQRLIKYIEVKDTYALLCSERDKMYPENPVRGGDEDHG